MFLLSSLSLLVSRCTEESGKPHNLLILNLPLDQSRHTMFCPETRYVTCLNPTPFLTYVLMVSILIKALKSPKCYSSLSLTRLLIQISELKELYFNGTWPMLPGRLTVS